MTDQTMRELITSQLTTHQKKKETLKKKKIKRKPFLERIKERINIITKVNNYQSNDTYINNPLMKH